jgi:hypothetical protein
MEPMPPLNRDAYVAQMRQQMEAMLGQVADAINNARDGETIAGSECQVKIDAAEAAFPPSAGSGDRQDAAE